MLGAKIHCSKKILPPSPTRYFIESVSSYYALIDPCTWLDIPEKFVLASDKK